MASLHKWKRHPISAIQWNLDYPDPFGFWKLTGSLDSWKVLITEIVSNTLPCYTELICDVTYSISRELELTQLSISLVESMFEVLKGYENTCRILPLYKACMTTPIFGVIWKSRQLRFRINEARIIEVPLYNCPYSRMSCLEKITLSNS